MSADEDVEDIDWSEAEFVTDEDDDHIAGEPEIETDYTGFERGVDERDPGDAPTFDEARYWRRVEMYAGWVRFNGFTLTDCGVFESWPVDDETFQEHVEHVVQGNSVDDLEVPA